MLVLRWTIGSMPMQLGGLTLIAVFYSAALLLVVLHRDGWAARVTCWEPLRQCGIWAYCLYLMHLFVPHYVFGVVGLPFVVSSAATGVLFVISTILLFAIATVSWKYFEKPLVDYGRFWDYHAARYEIAAATALNAK